LTLVAFAALSALLAGKSPTTAPTFSLAGRPIHPLSILPLVGDLADEQPRIAAVDLEGSARSATNRVGINNAKGVATAQDGDGYVGYRHLGETPGGLHVLVVFVNGGGSGTFKTALWVKLIRDRVSEDGRSRDRTTLVKVGSFTLGDRDDGDVRLDGTKLFIGKSRYRDEDAILAIE
jgi:hypothetical protein